MATQSFLLRFRTAITSSNSYNKHLALNVSQRLKHETVDRHDVTEEEAMFIADLRGSNGRKAKLAAFRLMTAGGKFTFTELSEIFPNYTPIKKPLT